MPSQKKEFYLLLRDNPEARHRIADAGLVVGKSPEADVHIDDPYLSGLHARFFLDDSAQVVVEDLGSRNGTYLNGKRTLRSVVPAGESDLRLGRVQMEIEGVDIDLISNQPAAVGQTDSPATATGSLPVAQVVERVNRLNPAEREYKAKLFAAFTERMERSKSIGESDEKLKQRIEKILKSLFSELKPGETVREEAIRSSILSDVLGLGPLESLLDDDTITEVMVNSEDTVFIERDGRVLLTDVTFKNRAQLMHIIERIVSPLGRRIDESSPLVDARLPDGSRVNAIIPPLAIDGPSLTIRKFGKSKFSTEDLINWGSMTRPMADFLKLCVENRLNILISGGTGSGKTTLLNILSSFIPEGERIVTIEDSAELRLDQQNTVRLEARPANMEGKGRVSIRDLVINSLRMRPDRIVVGECRGGEALDMVQAMNTGHDGSLTTAHANSPRDALRRIEVMCLMSGMELPMMAIREQVASAVDLIVQISRFKDGSRKVICISDVTGMEGDRITLQDIFKFQQTGYNPDGKVLGSYCATGNIPSWIEEARASGASINLELFKSGVK
jgi:pilus assembly protein CpaF